MSDEIADEILALKKSEDFCILAHSYMSEEICSVADFVGDSYALAVKAKDCPNRNILMCGVRFMAETAKILSPEKNVFLANAGAGCQMADAFTREDLEMAQKAHPGAVTVSYVNTTADVKAISDVCCTSSSAVRICEALEEKDILFVPDKNLGAYVQRQLPEKNIILVEGCCPVHACMATGDIEAARRSYPDAEILTHPECPLDVLELSDFVGSTAAIMEYAEKSPKKEFVIGTERTIVDHLRRMCPEKRFHELSPRLVCVNMQKTSLEDVLDCLSGGGDEIVLGGDTYRAAARSIERMIELGG